MQSRKLARGNHTHFKAVWKIHTHISSPIVIHFPIPPALQLPTTALSNTPSRHTLLSWAQPQPRLPPHVFTLFRALTWTAQSTRNSTPLAKAKFGDELDLQLFLLGWNLTFTLQTTEDW